MVDSNNRPRSTKEAKRLSADMSRIGMVLSGRYELTELLGRGGMGAVYKARHMQMDRFVAVKMLLPELIEDDPSMHDRFLREAKSSGKISHPNVVQLLDFGDGPEGEAYIVIEYLHGIGLDKLLEMEGRLSFERAVDIFEQICDGVGKAHAKGIIHRDLKPSNVMLVEEEGRADFVKIVDFGLAKAVDVSAESQKLTRTGEIFGSPVYMSPEQCMGGELDARSDIYAMGILMYECLTGQVPFIGANLAETVAKHLQEPAAKFSAVLGDHDIPRALESVVLKALSKDRYDRQASLQQLKDEILEALNSESGAAVKTRALFPAAKSKVPDEFIAGSDKTVPIKNSAVHETLYVSSEPPLPPNMVPGAFIAIISGIVVLAVLVAGVYIGVGISRSNPEGKVPAKTPSAVSINVGVENKARSGVVDLQAKKKNNEKTSYSQAGQTLSTKAEIKKNSAGQAMLSADPKAKKTIHGASGPERKVLSRKRIVDNEGNESPKQRDAAHVQSEPVLETATSSSRRKRRHDWHDYSYGVEGKESYAHSWSVPVAGSKSE